MMWLCVIGPNIGQSGRPSSTRASSLDMSPNFPKSSTLLIYPISVQRAPRFPQRCSFKVHHELLVIWTSPRSLCEAMSPAVRHSRCVVVGADPPVAATDESHQRSTRSVLALVQPQGELDVKVEGAKGTLASSVSYGGCSRSWTDAEVVRSKQRLVELHPGLGFVNISAQHCCFRP